MNLRIWQITKLFVVAAVLLAVPVTAAVNTIPVGGTVFIGEQGLDLSANANIASGTYIGWWEPGTTFASAPAYQMPVSSPTSFYVDPGTFSSRTGPWYNVTDKSLVINVVDPTIALKIYDVTVDSDRTEYGWIPSGDQVQFRIDSNLYQIANRPGIPGSGAPVTIKIQSPQGTILSSVVNSAGASTSLDPVYVGSSSYTPDAVWDTSTYSPGNYQFWAVCNANGMNDNYNIVGKTITGQYHEALQDINPGIQRTTTVPTTPATTQSPSPAATTAAKTPSATTPLPVPTSVVNATTIAQSPSATSQPPSETTTAKASPSVTRASGFGSLIAICSLVGLLSGIAYMHTNFRKK